MGWVEMARETNHLLISFVRIGARFALTLKSEIFIQFLYTNNDKLSIGVKRLTNKEKNNRNRDKQTKEQREIRHITQQPFANIRRGILR